MSHSERVFVGICAFIALAGLLLLIIGNSSGDDF